MKKTLSFPLVISARYFRWISNSDFSHPGTVRIFLMVLTSMVTTKPTIDKYVVCSYPLGLPLEQYSKLKVLAISVQHASEVSISIPRMTYFTTTFQDVKLVV